jgi:UTP--glucose-1-phosphate uridylyltransferase
MPYTERAINEKFEPFENKMNRAGLPPIIIDTFRYYYESLLKGETGLLTQNDIEPIEPAEISDLERMDDLSDFGRSMLHKAAIIKLNGGLGTSMGLERAKSLLEIKEGMNFLDITVKQVLRYRKKHANKMPLILMNSFRTDEDTEKALAGHKGIKTDIPCSFLQFKVPKILQETMAPAEWPQDRTLEWNPPGHGDIYIALWTSGILTKLIDAGIVYAFISNSDNLGAVMDTQILGLFAKNNLPFLMEVADRTRMDKKGGHLARLKENGRLVLRESAQCPDEEAGQFQDINLYRYFNTNNIWINLLALKEHLRANNNMILLPLIRNPKTCDPRDKSSPPVYQVETAMGAAISVFDGADAIRVPRTRFRPVKQCNDLLALWSDCFVRTNDYNVIKNPKRTLPSPLIRLDSAYYKMIDQLRERFAQGVPSLIACESLDIKGDVKFEAGVVIRGKVKIVNRGKKQYTVPQGTVIDGADLEGGRMTIND